MKVGKITGVKNVSIKNHVEWAEFLNKSKAEDFTGDNYYGTNTNQFIIETEYPNWGECLNVFTEPNYSEKTEYPDRTQFSINPELVSEKITSWVLNKIKEHIKHFDNIYPFESWAINYKDAGYQAVHNHTKQPSLISMIMFFDTITDEQRIQPTDGCTYTLMPHTDGNQMCSHFNPYPGKVIIFDGKVYHGTYPCKAPRRSFVVNYKYEYVTMEPRN